MDMNFFRDMTYGMFVISTKDGSRDVGCVVNTISQITSQSMIMAVSVNKENFTNQAIKKHKKFAVSVLSQDTNPEVIGKFGFFSSKDVDKFEPFEKFYEDGIAVLNENICGFMICELVQVVSVDTHDIFLAKVVDCKKVGDVVPMTYAYYHAEVKGKAPKTAPTYVEEESEKSSSGKKYKCLICGHIYDEAKEGVAFDDLPADWKCPICGVGKECFELVEE